MEVVKAVLVTGASTGIGRKTTERLVDKGCFVYAGARKEEDLQALRAIRNVHAIRLEVTDSRDIAAAVKAIKEGGLGLYGLVNNAGIATHGPVIEGDEREFDLVMAINVRAPYLLTKAFAPLLIAEKGRIVTIGSIAGVLAKKDFSAYSMSKLAMEALTDSLAAEMEPLGVHVSIVIPGQFDTKLVRNFVERAGANPVLLNGPLPNRPDDVAVAVTQALLEPQPKRRYLVVSGEDEADKTIRKKISQVVQMNEGHFYTFDRMVLVSMLDEALARARPRSIER
jgi:NAD(P)-dependent dehydrogenase (short-subunit alcohol dehydrogenase family)